MVIDKGRSIGSDDVVAAGPVWSGVGSIRPSSMLVLKLAEPSARRRSA